MADFCTAALTPKAEPEKGTADAASIMQQWLIAPDEERAKFCKWAGIGWDPPAPVKKPAKAKPVKSAAPAKQPRKAAKPVRKSNAGRKPDDPKVKREKTFRKLFISELAEQLLPTKLAIDAPHVAYLRKQPPENQYVAACWIGNGHGHDLDDLKRKIALEKDNAAEWYADRNAEAAEEGADG